MKGKPDLYITLPCVSRVHGTGDDHLQIRALWARWEMIRSQDKMDVQESSNNGIVTHYNKHIHIHKHIHT